MRLRRSQSVEKPNSTSHPIETGGVYAGREGGSGGGACFISANLRQTGILRNPRAALGNSIQLTRLTLVAKSVLRGIGGCREVKGGESQP